MKKLTFLIFLIAFSVAANATKLDEFFAKADAFYKKYVISGRVNYASLKSNHAQLDDLIDRIANMPLSSQPTPRSKAFLINAYNLYVIKDISRFYPMKSPKSIPGFFDKKRHEVAGRYYTLDDLEKTIISGYEDPVIHFLLVRGAKGSPELPSQAYRHDKFDAQSKAVMRKALTNEHWLKVDDATKSIQITEIISWHKEEYGDSDEKVIEFLNTYLPSEKQIPAEYTIQEEYIKYNWYLNRKPSK